MRFTSAVIYLQSSRGFPKCYLDLYSDCDVHPCFPIRNYAGRKGTRGGDPKESEETYFYQCNSINVCW